MKQSLSKLYSGHLGDWISVSEDFSKVHAHSKSLDRLVKEVRKRKIKKGVILKIPSEKYSAYVG
ncbi:hypothetical protein HY502_01465 [Candidatus Woesebacteria bacterium]|nr:hypothetical protein [Candidatus Woesebacteria bacterium]